VIRLIVSSKAESDLVKAFDYYEDKVAGLGTEFIRCIDAEIARVIRSPLAFRIKHGPHRMAMIERFPFAIYFIYDESINFVSIRRILHFAQDVDPRLK
jgi:toxin ParE1/3/4